VPMAYTKSDGFFVPNRDSRRVPNIFGSRIDGAHRESHPYFAESREPERAARPSEKA